jgi:ketosteroid isomerase-like protein
MSEQDNIQTVQDAYAAFKKGDINGLLNMLTEDVEWITPGPTDVMPAAGTRRGRAGVADFFSTLSKQEDVELFEPEEYIAQGEKVVAINRYRGRIKATGRTAETVVVHVFDMKDGKVKRFREFFDTAAVLPAFSSAQAAAPK